MMDGIVTIKINPVDSLNDVSSVLDLLELLVDASPGKSGDRLEGTARGFVSLFRIMRDMVDLSVDVIEQDHVARKDNALAEITGCGTARVGTR